jgi:hypothetical protein
MVELVAALTGSPGVSDARGCTRVAGVPVDLRSARRQGGH